MKRKMPHADDTKTDGKFDKKKFDVSLPDATEALASGETKVHKVVIEADKNGKPTVEIHRSHNRNSGGLDPSIALALQKVLVDAANAGTVQIADMSEGPIQSVLGATDALIIKGA